MPAGVFDVLECTSLARELHYLAVGSDQCSPDLQTPGRAGPGRPQVEPGGKSRASDLSTREKGRRYPGRENGRHSLSPTSGTQGPPGVRPPDLAPLTISLKGGMILQVEGLRGRGLLPRVDCFAGGKQVQDKWLAQSQVSRG